MPIISWQVQAGAATELAPDLRVTAPANLNLSTSILYEAPQNAHRSPTVPPPVRAGDHIHGLMGLASAVASVLKDPQGQT
jgi:hypothetical protein